MSYIALARKWRPQNFQNVVGQQHVVTALTNALDHERVHHAFLFSGTRGVGKTTIARILAKALNCNEGLNSIPCEKCDSCKEVANGNFIDLIEVDAASRTKVDDTRALLDNVQYSPVKGRYKVYLIDEVHMLSKSSFNALLKTLEEPPAHVKFIMATTEPQKLPATILSRCMQINLQIIEPLELKACFCKILKEEKIQYDDEAVSLLSVSARGSVRDGLSLLDQAIVLGGGAVKTKTTQEMLGIADRQHTKNILRAVVEADAKAAMQCLDILKKNATNFVSVLDDLLIYIHAISLYQLYPAILSPSQTEAIDQDLANLIEADELQLFYQIVLIGKRDIHYAPTLQLGFEMILLRMLAFRPNVPHATTAKVDQQKNKNESSLTSKVEEVVKTKLEPAINNIEPQKETSQYNFQSLNSKFFVSSKTWKDFVLAINLEKTIESHLMQMVPVSSQGNQVTLYNNKKDHFALPTDTIEKIQRKTFERFGVSVRFLLKSESYDNSSDSGVESKSSKKGEAKQSFANDKMVQKIAAVFDAVVDEKSISRINPNKEN